MARKYSNRDQPQMCSEHKPSKQERKDMLHRAKGRVKRYNKHLDGLADMVGDYQYNQTNINELIGAATVALAHAKQEYKGIKNGS